MKVNSINCEGTTPYPRESEDETTCLASSGFTSPLLEKKEEDTSLGVKNCSSPSQGIEPNGENSEEEADEDCEIAYFMELEACTSIIFSLDRLLLVRVEDKSLSPQSDELKSGYTFRCESKKVHLLPTASMDPDGAAAKVEKLAKLLEPYQQLPHLLHPHLEVIIPPLLRILQRFLPCATEIWSWEEAGQQHQDVEMKSKEDKIASDSEEGKVNANANQNPQNSEKEDPYHLIITSALGQDFSIFDSDAPKEAFHLVSRALYVIIKTAGEKACTSHFPNNVSYYEDVFYALRWWARSPLRQREWEVRYCLLLWLCNLVLVPFSMHLIDTTAITRSRMKISATAPQSSEPTSSSSPLSTSQPLNEQSKVLFTVSSAVVPSSLSLENGSSLADATLIAAVSFLQDSTKCRDAAALLVARLLTRPDSKHQRDIFFRFTNDIVRAVHPVKRCPGFLWDGLLAVLAASPTTSSLITPICTSPWSSFISSKEDSMGFPGVALGERSSAKIAEDKGHAAAALLSKCFLPGVLMAVAKTMKAASREEVVRYSGALVEFLIEELWEPIFHGTSNGQQSSSHVSSGDTLLVKLCVKVVQRLVLAMLPNRRASWRYFKSTTVMNLVANLISTEKEEKVATDASKGNLKSDGDSSDRNVVDGLDLGKEKEGERRSAVNVNSGTMNGAGTVNKKVNLEKKEEEECDFDDDAIDENVLELGIDLLLEALGHHDTIVRWSAAKGIGRICDRLPAAMAADVINAVLDLLSKGGEEAQYNDRVWHGGMLAIAELCRRGLLLRKKLDEVVPLMEKGLTYDIPKGTYSVGAHVRDAAAYACWSLARAYDAEDILPHVFRLSGALVATSLLDRHVNVRRAASAAFQECVGRLGTFPHGIPLCTMMDFFSLSTLSNAYLQVTPKVAAFPMYRHKILEVLVHDKLLHWDRSVRVVAAQALGRVARLEVLDVDAEKGKEEKGELQQPDGVSSDPMENTVLKVILPELLNRVTDDMVSTRHGAILGVVSLIQHSPSHMLFSFMDSIISIIPRLDAARMFRSRGGEYVREACCQLLEAIASHPLPIPEIIQITKINGMVTKVKTLGKLQEFLEDSWANILDWLQRTATRTFLRFAKVYYTEFRPAFHGKMLHKMFFSLISESVPLLQRKGVIGAIGGVPRIFLLKYPLTSTTPPANEVEDEEEGWRRRSEDCITGSSGGERGGMAKVSYWVLVLALLCRLAVPAGSSPLPNSLSKMVDLREEGETDFTSVYGGWKTFELVLSSCTSTLSANSTSVKEETESGSLGKSRGISSEVMSAVLKTTSADPECRRNAVKALSQVFTAVPKGSFSGKVAVAISDGIANNLEEAVVAKEVVRTLLKALEDYATDHRGDIGSVVRMAVLDELPAVTLHAHELLSQEGGYRSEPSSPSLFVQVLRGVLRALFEKLDRVRECAGRVLDSLLLCDEETTSRLISACSEEEEKEIRILQSALLQRFGRNPEPHHKASSSSDGASLQIDDCAQLKTMPTKDRAEDDVGPRKCSGMSWRSPQLMIDLGPALLSRTPHCFAQAVMDGIVTSAGDVTDYIRKPALQALRTTFSTEGIVRSVPVSLSGAAAQDHLEESGKKVKEEEEEQRRGEKTVTTMRSVGALPLNSRYFSTLLVNVSTNHSHEERMVVALSRVLDVLFTEHLLSPSVHVKVMNFLRAEMKYFATSIRTLLVLVTLLGSLCRSPCEEARRQAWMLSLTMIASRYPKVRAVIASEFYTALLSLTATAAITDSDPLIPCPEDRGNNAEGSPRFPHKDAIDAGEVVKEEIEEIWRATKLGVVTDGCVKAMEHLQKTAWDGSDATAIREARHLLYPMLGLTPPPGVAGGLTKSIASAAPKREMVASTYRSLVDEAGY